MRKMIPAILLLVLAAVRPCISQQIELVGSYTGISNVTDIAVRGDYAFLTSWQPTLLALDVSDPAHPQYVDHYDTLRGATGVLVNGDYIYLCDANTGLWVFNANDAAHLNPVGDCPMPGSPLGICIDSTQIYSADYAYSMYVVDISDPLFPVSIGAIDTLDNAVDVAVAGDSAYLVVQNTNQQCELEIIDISDPTDPVFAGALHSDGLPRKIEIAGRYAYVADQSLGLQIIDIADTLGPNLVGTCDTPGMPYDLHVAYPYVYLADGPAGLHVINVIDPVNPAIVATFSRGNLISDVLVANGYIYAMERNAFVVLRFIPSAIDDVGLLPGASAVLSNYPNPFNSRTSIAYSLPERGEVEIFIYNLLGQRVAVLHNGIQPAGPHTLAWDAGNLPSGLYFAHLLAGSHCLTANLVLLK